MEEEYPRLLAIAKRCQLLTGSSPVIQTSCPCGNPSECQLTPDQRDRLRAHPEVAKVALYNAALHNQSRDGYNTREI